MSDSYKLTVVVGGAGGIGSEISNVLRCRGDEVVVVGRSSTPEIQITSDLSTEVGRKQLVQEIGCREVDNLIFAHRYRGDDTKKDFDVTFNSVLDVVKDFESIFSRDAAIVVLSSIAARQILDEQSCMYHASRAALESMTRFLAVKMGSNGVRVNCILPTTLIKSTNERFFRAGNPVHDLIANVTPLKRMGHAKDIANLVEFLCSSRSSFITGQSFVVDGGLSIVNQETIARRLTNLKH